MLRKRVCPLEDDSMMPDTVLGPMAMCVPNLFAHKKEKTGDTLVDCVPLKSDAPRTRARRKESVARVVVQT